MLASNLSVVYVQDPDRTEEHRTAQLTSVDGRCENNVLPSVGTVSSSQ